MSGWINFIFSFTNLFSFKMQSSMKIIEKGAEHEKNKTI